MHAGCTHACMRVGESHTIKEYLMPINYCPTRPETYISHLYQCCPRFYMHAQYGPFQILNIDTVTKYGHIIEQSFNTTHINEINTEMIVVRASNDSR